MRDRNTMSPKPGPLRSEGAKSQAIGYTKAFSTQKVQDSLQNLVSRGDASRVKSNLRKAPGNLLAVINSETTSVYSSPCESSSESDAITEDSTRAPSVAAPKLLRRSRYETSMRKKVVLNKNGGEIIKRREIIKSLGKEASESQDKVKGSGLNLRGGISQLAFQNGNLWDDTTSTQEDDSLCSSGKLSDKKTCWTWTCSTCTEEDSQQRDSSPSERPAKKSCGDRASSLQPSREVPCVWNSIERITSKSSYRSDCRLDESKESANVYETGCAIKAEDKDGEERHTYTSQELASLQESNKDEKQKRDRDRVKVQESGRQAHAQSVLEISANFTGPELFHAEIAWIASRGTQRMLGSQDKKDECTKQELQNLHDEEPCNGSNWVKTNEHISHNRLREAVEAVWKTSLGTKGGVEKNQDGENALLGNCYWDQNNEDNLNIQLLKDKNPRENLQEQSSAQAAPCENISAYEKTWKETSGTINRGHENYFEKEPSPLDENVSAYKRSWPEALGKNNNDQDNYLAKEPSGSLLVTDEKVSAYKTASKKTFGAKNEYNYFEKEPSDLIFWCIQRDHEDLKALVAREEGLQKEQKDLALIQLASEGRARGAAVVQKNPFHETCPEAAEEIHAMLNERAVFHSKFKEELEQGVTDKFMEQELLHLQSPTIESEEIQVRVLRRSLQESLPEGKTEIRRSLQESLPERTSHVRRSFQESLQEGTREVRSLQESLPEETREVRRSLQESLPEEPREVRRSFQGSLPEEATEVRRSCQESILEEIMEARSFQEALPEGTMMANKSPHQEPRTNPMLIHGGPGPNTVQLKLMAESESRIAAEAKASYFEACAKAAEKRMNSLLDERNWYYKRFVEEVEYNSDMKRLQELMEIDKARQERHGKPQKQKLDVRLLVASSVANENLDEDNKEHDTASRQSKPEELLQEDTDWQSDGLDFAKCQQELEKTMSDGKSLGHELTGQPEQDLSDLKDGESVEGSYISESSIPSYGDRYCKHEFANWQQESEKSTSSMKGPAHNLRGSAENGLSDLKKDEEIAEENRIPVSSIPYGGKDCKHEFTSIPRYAEKDCKHEFTSVPRYGDRDAKLNLNLTERQQELENTRIGDTKGLAHHLKDKSDKKLSDLKKNEESIEESYTSASHIPRYGSKDTKQSQQELGNIKSDKKGLAHDLQGHQEKDSSNLNKDDETIEESFMPASPIPRYGDVNPKRETVTYNNTSQKNEKKRPLSPIKSSKAKDWKSPEVTESVKIDPCSVTRRRSSEIGRNPGSSQGSDLATKACNDFEEDIFNVRKSPGLPPNNCAVSTLAASVTPLSIPNKWEKQTKAELHKIIKQQELTWKMAENAVEDLARRLAVLENYKTNLQDTLKRSRAVSKMDSLFSRLEKNLEEFPGGFNILYTCPIFEEQEVEERTSKNLAQKRCMSPNLSKISTNYEIQKNGVDKNSAQKRCISPNVSQISRSYEIHKNGVEKNFAQKRCMSLELSQLIKKYEIQENGADKNPAQTKCITPNVSHISKDYEIKEDRVEKTYSQRKCTSPKLSQISKSYEIQGNGVAKNSDQKSQTSPNVSQTSKHHKILGNGVEKGYAQKRCISPKGSQIPKINEIQDNGVEKNSAQTRYIFPNVSQISKDYEIQLLKAEIAQLRNEISRRERDCSPQVQSTNFLSSFEAVLRYTDPVPLEKGSAGHHSVTEVIAPEIGPEIPDYSFQKKNCFATKELPKSRSTDQSKRHHSAPEVHTTETELELPDDSFQKKKLSATKATPKSRSYSPSKRHYSAPELIATETKPELPDDPFQTKTSSATAEAPMKRSVSPSKDDRPTHSNDSSPSRRAHGLNGSWSPNLDEESGAQIFTPISENDLSSEHRGTGCSNSCHNHITAGNVKLDEGNLQAARIIVKKLSAIFEEEEANFQTLGAASKGPSESMDTHGFYLVLLKRLSQRLTQFCHNLDDDFPTHQKCHQVKSTDKKIAPFTEAINFTTYTEVEQENRREVVKPNMITANNPSFRAQQPHELVRRPVEPGNPKVALHEAERKESTNPRAALQEAERKEPAKLRVALQIAEREMEEELKANFFLTGKLEDQAKHISEVMAENVEELVRKDQKLSYEQQVNTHLVRDMAKTEKSLEDLRSRSKELVTDLDCRLQTARNEVTTLQDTVDALKIDLKRKENLASSLKGERSKTQVQTQDLKSQIQIFKRETDTIAGEKLELMNGIKQTRTETDEQNHRIKEFIIINEDLIAVAQSKENEVKTLTKMVTSLKKSISEKSDEAKRLSGETERLSQDLIEAKEDVKTYNHHQEFLQSKLEDTEQELVSREEAVERLTVHLGKTIEGQHFILEEKEQLLLSLNKSQSKERKLDDEAQHLKTGIQDLEEKLNCRDAELNRIRAAMEDTKARRLDEIESQKEQLRNRVDQLEDEIMEKEGQIAILTTSTP